MFQSWRKLIFFHWRYEASAIRPLIPGELVLDTFDGSAWIGLTPLLIRHLRPRYLPPLPWISYFPEINVRTYVTGPDGQRGIWFFTLEADRLAAVIGARVSYRLPYRWADIRFSRGDDTVEYHSTRKQPFGCGHCAVSARIGKPIEPGDLELFLTARFRLYTRIGGRLAFAQIEHEPWPLCAAEALAIDQDLIQSSGVPAASGTPTVVHYSPGVDARVGRPHRV
jgi:uncharacterized protein